MRIAIPLLLFLPAFAFAGSPADTYWSTILPVYRSRIVHLERSEEKADRAKAKALAKLVARAEKPRRNLADDGKLACRFGKTIRKKFADDPLVTSQFDWVLGSIEDLVREACEDAAVWAASLPASKDRDRAAADVDKAECQQLLAAEAAERRDRARALRRAARKLARAEKRLAKLGPRPEPVPVIRNPGFDSGSGDVPDGWTNWAPPTDICWEAGENRCVGLGTDEPAYQHHWFQSVRNLVPGRAYNVTARVRGEDVIVHTSEPEKLWGATIGLAWNTLWRSDKGARYQGTFDWTEISFTFRAREERETIELRLGAPGYRMSGRVWFDDVRISAGDWLPGPPEGEHVRLFLETEDVAAAGLDEDWIEGWLRHLDHVYLQYADLVGGVPYDGEKIDIQSVHQYPGGWAIAGNPILWQKRYVATTLERFRLIDDWSFGILHEIGHDFDLDYRWVYQAEVQANFKMVYALEKLGGSVWQRGALYTGGDIQNVYRDVWSEAKAAGEVTSWGGWLYRVLCVQDEIGWEPFRQLYRSYPEGQRTRLERFELYFDELERHSGVDIRGTLIPADELAWVREQLE